MTRLQRLWRRGDRGVVVVEAAIVLPLFFALLFALADFSMAEVGNASGANAAREGARVGIINFANADQSASANHAKIVAAVNAKLAGMVEKDPEVTVACLKADGTTPTGYGCDPSKVQIGSDLVKVTVHWTQIVAIGLIANKHRNDSAIMRIVGGTTTSGGSGSGACTLSNQMASPSTVTATGGKLDQSTPTTPAITFSVTVSSLTDCGVPSITLPSESGLTGSQTMTQVGSSNVFSYAYPPTSPPVTQSWTSGAKTAQLQQQGAAAGPISFTVGAPSTCTFQMASPNPTSLAVQNKNSSQIKNGNQYTVKLSVNDQGACATPQLYTTGLTTSPFPQGSPTNMTWSVTDSAYEVTISSSVNSTPWHSGDSGSIVMTGPGGVSTSIPVSVA
jgi:hypothetical protein